MRGSSRRPRSSFLLDEFLTQIIIVWILVTVVLAGLIWWFKRDAFLSMVVLVFLSLLGAVFYFLGLGPGDSTSPSELRRAELQRRELEAARLEEKARQEKEAMLASLTTFERFRPVEKPELGYSASDACRECHPHNHATWHASYHRTMTQVATPEAVLGNFDNVEVTAHGRPYKLTRFGEVNRVEMYDPEYPPSPDTKIEASIVMVTGSHHMQIYWYPLGYPRTLGQLPIVYLKETDQWLPYSAIFLEPPDTPVSIGLGRWNSGCSKCHSTGRRERKMGPASWDTEVSEFGISCDACHGPGEAHIAFHRRRESAASSVDPIVNPADLTHQASSDICGQCHGLTLSKEDGAVVNHRGHGFRPGADLAETHHILKRDGEVQRAYLAKMGIDSSDESVLRNVYWNDGNVRVSGREYSGMIESSCFQRGELSCLSCHRLHQDESDDRSRLSWANDQLSLTGLDDQACTQCHEAANYGTSHTHHPLGSAGSQCYNCHMPHTSYGLLKAIRSHTITSPDVGRDLQAGRPNACNLCHLDKTLDWTAQTMAQWYESEIPDLSQEQKEVSAAVLWLLKGDAGDRALAAWSMGWEDAQQVSGVNWIAPLLSQLLVDPYEAVRIISRRSLRSLPQFGDLEFNAVAAEEERTTVMKSVWKIWESTLGDDLPPNPEILIDESGLQTDRVKELMLRRDDTPVRLLE